MPCWTGADALELVRLQGWRIPVILVTAFHDEATIRTARKHDAWVLDKPFDLEVLSAAAFEALSRRESASQPEYGPASFALARSAT